jgi:pimeloyl-ACP methyl ester carboxylesterase
MKRSIVFEGIRVSYNVTGRGKTMVLLHGYLEAGEVWGPLVKELADGYRIITPDLPGHGESGILSDVHTMEFLASAIRAVIIDAGSEKVLMAGHSLGGYVTLAFLELYPDLLSGYILFHSHPHADSLEAISRRNREIDVVRAGKKNIMYPGNVSMMFAEKNLRSMAPEVERSKQIASLNSGDGIIALLNGMIARPSRQYTLENGTVPLMWILGRHDLYFSPEKAMRDIGLPFNAEVVILEESGHMGFIEEKEKSVLLIKSFAERIKW